MEYLDQIVSRINSVVSSELTNHFFCDSVCKVVNRNEERANIDKDGNAVMFDDCFDYYCYHRLNDISHTELKKGGKGRLYENRANMSLFVFTKDRNFHDCLLNKLTSIKEISILNTNFDSYTILRNETSKTDYDPSQFIFVVNYQVQYRTSYCVSYACS